MPPSVARHALSRAAALLGRKVPAALRASGGRRTRGPRLACRVRRSWGVAALLALLVATAGPSLQAASGVKVKGLGRRHGMELRSAEVALRVLRRAPTPHRGSVALPWQAVWTCCDEADARRLAGAAHVRVRDAAVAVAFSAPSPPAAPSRAPPLG
jgi:hypothetical protein